MTLTPMAIRHQPRKPSPDVDPGALDIPIGTMIEGPWGWHEYCEPCATRLLAFVHRRNRAISLFEVKVSYRHYVCCACDHLLWDPIDLSKD